MKFNLFRKSNFVEWSDFVDKLSEAEEFAWRQKARRTLLN